MEFDGIWLFFSVFASMVLFYAIELTECVHVNNHHANSNLNRSFYGTPNYSYYAYDTLILHKMPGLSWMTFISCHVCARAHLTVLYGADIFHMFIQRSRETIANCRIDYAFKSKTVITYTHTHARAETLHPVWVCMCWGEKVRQIMCVCILFL